MEIAGPGTQPWGGVGFRPGPRQQCSVFPAVLCKPPHHLHTQPPPSLAPAPAPGQTQHQQGPPRGKLNPQHFQTTQTSLASAWLQLGPNLSCSPRFPLFLNSIGPSGQMPLNPNPPTHSQPCPQERFFQAVEEASALEELEAAHLGPKGIKNMIKPGSCLSAYRCLSAQTHF